MTQQLELPVYEVTPSKDFPGWLIVRCPREDCGEKFLVRKSTWMKAIRVVTYLGKEYKITGRSCPYCFRAATIPSRRRSRYNQGSPTTTRE